MKKLRLIGVVLAFATVTYSQEPATRARTVTSSDASLSSTQDSKVIEIANGARITGELQNSIDVRKAKVGDEVILKTTQAIKSGGGKVVNKGGRLFGRVTEVTQKTKDNNQSRLGLLFDRLEQGSLEMPVVASITSVTSSRASARSDDNEMASSDVSSRSTASSQGGGLIGGVTNTVSSTTGAVVGATTNAVGSVVRSTSNIVTGASGSLGRIQILESSDASVSSGSVLSLRGDNIRLEKGTTLNLMLNQSAAVEKN